MDENSIKLGSLFDGIGAFPYAASFFGIEPVWASEILPNSVSITKRHIPEMEHLGDITKIDGGAIPPVDVICFGSPCQSFSVAGPRTSFAGKSGLFFEAIRIIKEMRDKTNGSQPQIAIFENVPGVLNIDGGRSYKTIIEAFCEAEVPMPASGKWANAGMVRGGSVDFAWVCKDAQHYRVPQRRKRLLAVADFTGRRAAEILFESESLSGYFEARERARQGTSPDAESGADGAGGIYAGFNGYRSITGSIEYAEERAPCLNTAMPSNIVAAFMAGQAKNARSLAYNETLSPTLKGAASGLNQTPSVLCMATGQSDNTAAANTDISPTLTLNHEAPYICKEQAAYGICSHSSNSMLSGNPRSGIYEAETCRTLDRMCANPACNQGGIAIVEGNFPCEPQIARTLTARHDSSPCVDRGQNVVAFVQNQRAEVRDLKDVAGCLAAEPGVKQQTYVMQPEKNCLTPWDLQQSRIHTPNGPSPALVGADGGGGRNPAGLVMCAATTQANAEILTELCPTVTAAAGMSGDNKPYIAHPCIAGTLCASGAGMSRPAGNANETDLCVVQPASVCAYGFDLQQITSKTNRSSLKEIQPVLCKAGAPHVVISGAEDTDGKAYCLQGSMIGRADKNGPQGQGVNTEVSFTLNTIDMHAVATFSRQRSDAFKADEIASTQTARQYKDTTDIVCQPTAASVDCRNLYENEELSGTLQSKCTGGHSLNYQNPVRMGFVIRRLTPTECERLMSFDDGYTATGHDGKIMSDSARYQMLGNSIVVNVLAYIMQNVAKYLGKESSHP